ncbi:MAG: hypothetical protein EBR08_02540, partial [Bacteroidia bacterium]|nr:hypothetical protein [Bacteroidia bacterium]
GVEFSDVETYKKKLEIIKENYFPTEKKVSSVLTEEVEEVQEETKAPVTGPMNRYVNALSRTIKK